MYNSNNYITIEPTTSSVSTNKGLKLKTMGEACGEGYGDQGWENCGQCESGLECEANHYAVKKCMTCIQKSG